MALELPIRVDLEPSDYLELIMKKTCWYTTVLPLRVGALIGSRGTAAAKAEALEAKGVRVGRTPTQVAEVAVSLLGAAA